MTYQHSELANGQWERLPLKEQLANVGSDVGRALRWRGKSRPDYSQSAFERSLELLSLSIDDRKNRDRLNELTRLYELLVDYFVGENEYHSTPANFERYFHAFNVATRSGY